jgi:leucyl aminopeptidase
MPNCFVTDAKNACPIHVIQIDEYDAWLQGQSELTKSWLTNSGFIANPGSYSVVPGDNGSLAQVVCCVADKKDLWSVGSLPMLLPAGVYQFVEAESARDYAIAWGLGAYQFTRYKQAKREPAQLCVDAKDIDHAANIVDSIYLTRDLVNTPTEDMGPSELAEQAEKLAKEFGAKFNQVVGDELLKNNYPAIHAVGRACDDAPRLLDLRWGDTSKPKVTLVGKGVCFDTGGLDLKPAGAMRLMKKDMGGSAHVLGLARMIMQAKLPVCLRVLIPAVENSVSGSSYRPGDVINSRKGLTIEVGNTDAEGRVVLADALAEASSESPDLLIDMATLTGAARIAVGTGIAAVFANNDDVVNAVIAEGDKVNDPVWRLPLFAGYREMIDSPIADLSNTGTEPYAGATTAGLFLQEFIEPNIPWMHFDIMAWNTSPKPGRPAGGEAMALRAIFGYMTRRFAG